MNLMTKAIAAKLFDNDKQVIANGESPDEIVVKYFNPCGPQTWYIVSATPVNIDGEPIDNPDDADDWHMFGFADLGDAQCAELGYVMLSDLEGHKGPLGLGIERDRYYEGHKLSDVQRETKARA